MNNRIQVDQEFTHKIENLKKNQSIQSDLFWDEIFFNTRGKYRFYYLTEIDIKNIVIEQRILVREKDVSLINRLTPQIEAEGLIEPLTVMDMGNNRFLLLAGQHRYYVCRNLGITKVPVKAYIGLDFVEQLTIGYMSNEMRKDPPAGRRYGALHEIFDETKRNLEIQLKRSPSEYEVINKMYVAHTPQVAKFKIKEILIGILTDDLIHDKDSLVCKHGFITVRQVPKSKIISQITNFRESHKYPLLTAQNAFYGLNHLIRTTAVTLEEENMERNFRRNEYENVKIFFDILISKYIKPWMNKEEIDIDYAMILCKRHVFEALCKLVSMMLRDKGFDVKTKDGTKAPLFTDRKIPWTELFDEIDVFFNPEFLMHNAISQERSMEVLWNRIEYYVILHPGRMPTF